MHVLLFTLLVFGGSVAAGLLGALTGLGGGVLLTPLLTLVFHVDIRYAIGASLVSVIATSSGAAAAYVREGFSNVRIGMFLEVATTLGALFGAWLAGFTPTRWLAVLFGTLRIAVIQWKRSGDAPVEVEDKIEDLLEVYRCRAADCLSHIDYAHPQELTVEALLIHLYAEEVSSYDFNPSIWVLLGVVMAVLAVGLLMAGGLKPLQTISLAAAFPFIFIMLFAGAALIKALMQEKEK